MAVEHVVELFAALQTALDDFDIHVFGHALDCVDGCVATAHNHHVLDIGILLLTHYLADVGDKLARGHEVGQVVELQDVVTARNDGIGATLHRHHVVRVLRTAELAERTVEYLASLAQLDAQQDEGSIVHIPTLAHPRHLETVVDVTGSEHLGIDELVDTQSDEELALVVFDIFGAVYARHGLVGTECLGQDTTVEVETLIGGYGDEEVGVAHAGIGEGLYAVGVGHHRQQVVVAADACQPVGVGVYERDVLVVAREQSCQMGTYGVGTGNNDFHPLIC